MNQEQKDFLSLRRLPAVLSRDQVAWLFGFETHEIDILVSTRKLRPLVRHSQTSKKVFPAVKIEQLVSDASFLDQARAAIQTYWAVKNSSRSKINATVNNK